MSCKLRESKIPLMKVALVHDYIKEFGGAERVLKTLTEIYPEASIYTAFSVKGNCIMGNKLMERRPKVKMNKLMTEASTGRLINRSVRCIFIPRDHSIN